MMSGNNSKYFSRQFSKKILAIAAVAAIVPAMHASTASASIADLYSGGAGT